ncbi:MAG: transcription termination factor Rho [Verrucomicrobiota bacterium]
MSEPVTETQDKPTSAPEAAPPPSSPPPERREDSQGGKDNASRSEGGDDRNYQRKNRNNNNNRRGRGKGRNNRGRNNRGRGGDKEFRKRDRDQGDRPYEEPSGPATEEEGMLEISGKGFGFLRIPDRNFYPSPKDVFVTPETVRNYGLRDGIWVKAEAKQGHRGPQLTKLISCNGLEPDAYKTLPHFDELKAVHPDLRYVLETSQTKMTTRIVDMMAPIGRGQRGLIVAPPRSGKTTLLQHMAEAVIENYKDVHTMIVLIDERPEEVTELKRSVEGAELIASSNDMDTRTHARTAQMAIERAKRLVEAGKDVFIVLDSITRLARQFNNLVRNSGRTGSGGLDVRAMEIPRGLFAAARNTRDAGSLTIIGTALVDTNSRMDEVIFQEFKGTGNMELVLERRIAEQYIFPAVDIFKSGTRREELLLPPHQLEKIHMLRRGLAGQAPIDAIERLIQLAEKYPSNAQMLLELKLVG